MPCCSQCAQGNPCSSLSGPPAGACGARYAHLVQASGRTKENPFGMWCNVEDAQAWYSQAKNVLGMVKQALAGATISTQLSAAVEGYKSDFANIPEPSQLMAFGMAGCSESVEASKAHIEWGACYLERIEDATAGTGPAPLVPGSALPPPPGADGAGGAGLGWGLGLGLGGGALLTIVGLYFLAKAID